MLFNYVMLFLYHKKYFASLKRVFADPTDSTSAVSENITFVIDSPGALRNPEWEQLNKYDFFRRSMAYYFMDRQLLRVYFTTMEKYFLQDKSR